jgi:hypothetical protein
MQSIHPKNVKVNNELWKPIPDAPGYEASNQGRIRSFRQKPEGHILSPSIHDNRLGVQVVMKGQCKYIRIAKLVALTFIGPCPDNMEICHTDGDSSNDRLENLRYDTHRNNMLDMRNHPTDRRGDRHPNSIFTATQVIKIREKYALCPRHRTIRALAEVYNTDPRNIRNVCSGKTYQNIGGSISSIPPPSITPNDAKVIRKLALQKVKYKIIAARFDISISYVSLIARGKRVSGNE